RNGKHFPEAEVTVESYGLLDIFDSQDRYDRLNACDIVHGVAILFLAGIERTILTVEPSAFSAFSVFFRLRHTSMRAIMSSFKSQSPARMAANAEGAESTMLTQTVLGRVQPERVSQARTGLVSFRSKGLARFVAPGPQGAQSPMVTKTS